MWTEADVEGCYGRIATWWAEAGARVQGEIVSDETVRLKIWWQGAFGCDKRPPNRVIPTVTCVDRQNIFKCL